MQAFKHAVIYTGYVVLLVLALVPFFWPELPGIERRFLPVTSEANILKIQYGDNEIKLYLSFVKNRDCEFLGVNWYRDGERLDLVFEDDGGDPPLSRPTGHQIAGPWVLSTHKLEGTKATLLHRCHPLWLTSTHFYP